MTSTNFLDRAPWEVSKDGCVVIDELVQISSNNGIRLWDWTNFTSFSDMPRWRDVADIIAEFHGIDRTRFISALENAIAYWRHDLIGEALCGSWPGGERGPISFDRFLEILASEEVRRGNRVAKIKFTGTRRREFQSIRAQLVLQMLDAGMAYRCIHPGCLVDVGLTVDHKLALSRGGGDELGNLQFMCLQHNSQKGDREL